MIQRVQTIWLFLAAITIFLTLELSFYSGTLISDNSFYALDAKDHFLLMVLTSALGSAVLINIFLFKHRKVQFRISLMAVIAECLIIYLYLRKLDLFSNGEYDIWAIFHLLTIIFLCMAARGVYKDEKLIKDSNRLR